MKKTKLICLKFIFIGLTTSFFAQTSDTISQMLYTRLNKNNSFYKFENITLIKSIKITSSNVDSVLISKSPFTMYPDICGKELFNKYFNKQGLIDSKLSLFDVDVKLKENKKKCSFLFVKVTNDIGKNNIHDLIHHDYECFSGGCKSSYFYIPLTLNDSTFLFIEVKHDDKNKNSIAKRKYIKELKDAITINR